MLASSLSGEYRSSFAAHPEFQLVKSHAQEQSTLVRLRHRLSGRGQGQKIVGVRLGLRVRARGWAWVWALGQG